MIKRWWNRRFPYYRLCGRRWCLRVQTYDYRCARHQDDNRPSPGSSGLAGFCEHGIGMLDARDECCPPVEATPVDAGQERP